MGEARGENERTVKMKTTNQNTERHMSKASNSQTVEREAQGSSIRPVNGERFAVSGRQQRKARNIARQISDTKQGRQYDAALIISTLSAFGGRISGFQISAQ